VKIPGYNFQQRVDKKSNKFISLTGSDSTMKKLFFTAGFTNFGIILFSMYLFSNLL